MVKTLIYIIKQTAAELHGRESEVDALFSLGLVDERLDFRVVVEGGAVGVFISLH